MKLTESYYFQGYYHVPKNERLVINRDGRIIDLRLMASLLQVKDKNKYDYAVINVIGQGTLHIHRLLAETFIPIDLDTSDLTVNHIDGNKFNNDLSNLEWVTRSQNLQHAFATGLRDDTKRTLSKDIVTNEVRSYYSVADCARALNIPTQVLRNYIKAKPPYPLDGRYEVVLSGDNWRGISTENIIHMQPTDASVVALVDDQYMVFDSAESAGRYLEISESTILRNIYNNNTPPYKNYLFFKKSEVKDRLGDDNSIYVPGSFKDLKPSNKKKPIVVKDLNTGHITEWEDAYAFARVVGINRSTIQKAIGKNNGKWNQYQFTYKNQSQ